MPQPLPPTLLFNPLNSIKKLAGESRCSENARKQLSLKEIVAFQPFMFLHGFQTVLRINNLRKISPSKNLRMPWDIRVSPSGCSKAKAGNKTANHSKRGAKSTLRHGDTYSASIH